MRTARVTGQDRTRGRKGAREMGRFTKFLLFLIVLAILAFIGYAYFGDLSPEQEDISTPVELDAG